MVVAPQVVHADLTTVSGNNLRQGWVSNETALTPASVANGGLQQRFDTSLPGAGQAYAEPLVIGSRVIVATEADRMYAVDRYTGAVDWMHTLGTPEPSSTIGCSDLQPDLGMTSTPVYDPSTSTIFVAAKTWDGTDAATATWRMHAVSLTTGAEVAGWPVGLDKTLPASNQPLLHFDPTQQQQRPGLLLMGGRVFAGFGSQCDIPSYQGWIASISTTTRSVKMWTAQQSATDTNGDTSGGIWMAGGGLMSDGPGRIFLSTGNGTCQTSSPAPGDNCFGPPVGPGTSNNANLAESVARVQVQADGTLTAVDHFTPVDAPTESSQDVDLGSSGVTALPDSFGVPGHPHLLVLGGKNGRDYLLDRDSLGGRGAPNSNNTDSRVVAETLVDASPVYGHAAIWPGDGGYIYFPGFSFNPCPRYTCGLDAYQVHVSGTGAVSLDRVATASTPVGFGTGSPVVSSNGTASRTALVWQVEMPNTTGETGPELRTYLPRPDGTGHLTLVSHVSLGHPVDKFIVPTIDNGQVFIGTADGHLLAFGAAQGCSGPPLTGDFTGDGTADVVSVGQTGTCVLPSTGTSFTAPAQWSNVPFFGQQATLAADVTTANRSDLVAVNNAGTWVMPSTGSAFSAPQRWSTAPFYGQRATLAGDLTGGGTADLIAVNNSSTWVMTNTGSTFSPPQQWSSTAFYGTRATLATDLNNDGHVDLVAVDDTSTWVMLNNGAGGFSAPQLWSNVAFFGSRVTLAGDVTGGGQADLVAVNDASTWVMTSTGSTFSAPQRWHSGAFPGSVATLGGDVNGDTRMDLVAVNPASTLVMTSNGSAFSSPARWWAGYP